MQVEAKSMYEQIYNDLMVDIKDKKYKKGDKLPSEKELATRYNVSRITSKKALEILALEGIITRKPGKGSFLSRDVTEDYEDAIYEKDNLSEDVYRDNSNKFIGLIIPDFGSVYGSDIVRTVEEECTKKGKFLIIRRTKGLEKEEKLAIKELLNIGVEAMIIFPVQEEYFSEDILKLIVDRYPFVLIDRYLKGLPATSISTDNKQASIDITNYLFELKHKNIALVSPKSINTTTVEDRIEGFMIAHDEKGIPVNKKYWNQNIKGKDFFDVSKGCIDEDVSNIKSFLIDNPEITAVFCIDYTIALICEKAIQEIGLRVKDDISIVCFDSPREESSINPKFTHIKQNEYNIGKTAVEKVINKDSSEFNGDHVLIEYKMVVGESTKYLK